MTKPGRKLKKPTGPSKLHLRLLLAMCTCLRGLCAKHRGLRGSLAIESYSRSQYPRASQCFQGFEGVRLLLMSSVSVRSVLPLPRLFFVTSRRLPIFLCLALSLLFYFPQIVAFKISPV